MKASSFRYIFPEPFNSLKRNSWMSVAAIVTMAITLLLCGVFWLLVMNINANATMMESQVEVKVFLADDATEADSISLKTNLESLAGVASVTFVSKEEGLDTLIARFGDKDRILAALGSNPLPDSYTVTATEPEDVVQIAEAAETMDKVQAVRYGQGTVENLFATLNWIRTIGVGIMVLLSVSAVLLISMTIRMTVIARREEIRVMKYVGASNWFIRWPFLLEGMFIGFLGALIALAIVLFSYDKLIDYMVQNLIFLTYISLKDVIFQTSAVMLFGGIVLGALGSIIPMRRFLKA